MNEEMTYPDKHDLYSILAWCGTQLTFIIASNLVSGLDILFKILSIVSVAILIDINLYKHWAKWKEIHHWIKNLFK